MLRPARSNRLICIAFAAFSVISGCEDEGLDVPPEIPVGVLLAAPDTLNVQNRVLTLSTYLWRDFMPSTDGDHTQLIALVRISATDTLPLPTGISTDALWIVSGREVWKSFFSDEPRPPEPRSNSISAIARDGLRWDGTVDVIVRVLDGKGGGLLLKAAGQQIGRVY